MPWQPLPRRIRQAHMGRTCRHSTMRGMEVAPLAGWRRRFWDATLGNAAKDAGTHAR